MVWMQFHPGLEHMRPRVEELTAELHEDALRRIARSKPGAWHRNLRPLIEAEERQLNAQGGPPE